MGLRLGQTAKTADHRLGQTAKMADLRLGQTAKTADHRLGQTAKMASRQGLRLGQTAKMANARLLHGAKAIRTGEDAAAPMAILIPQEGRDTAHDGINKINKNNTMSRFLPRSLCFLFFAQLFTGCTPVYTWSYAPSIHPKAAKAYILAVLARENGDCATALEYYNEALRHTYDEQVAKERDACKASLH